MKVCHIAKLLALMSFFTAIHSNIRLLQSTGICLGFQKTVLHQNVTMIACLATKIAGIGFGLDCVQYWPTIDEPMKFGKIKITSISRGKVNGLSKLV